SSYRAKLRSGTYTRGGNQRAARLDQRPHLYGMGEIRYRLEPGDYLRPGRRPPDSSWSAGELAQPPSENAADGSWRRELRADAVGERPHSGDCDGAARRSAADAGIHPPRSSGERRPEAYA